MISISNEANEFCGYMFRLAAHSNHSHSFYSVFTVSCIVCLLIFLSLQHHWCCALLNSKQMEARYFLQDEFVYLRLPSINHFAASKAHKMSIAPKGKKKQQRLEKQIRRVENDDDERQQQTNVGCTKKCLLLALLLLIYFVLNTVCFRMKMIIRQWRSPEKKSCMLHAAWKTNKSHPKLDSFLFHFTFYFITIICHTLERLRFVDYFFRSFVFSRELIYVKRIDLDTFFIIALPTRLRSCVHLDDSQTREADSAIERRMAHFFPIWKQNPSINEPKYKKTEEDKAHQRSKKTLAMVTMAFSKLIAYTRNEDMLCIYVYIVHINIRPELEYKLNVNPKCIFSRFGFMPNQWRKEKRKRDGEWRKRTSQQIWMHCSLTWQ